MKRWRALLLAILLTLGGPLAARTITDSAGRQVTVPERIERAYASGPPAMVLLYMLRPEVLTGWPRAPRPDERPFIAPAYRDLPETGRLTGRGGEANLEKVLAGKPDLILDFGSVRGTFVSLADRIQAQTGIPYVLIDGSLEKTPAALRLAGDILGVGERGRALARYVEDTFSSIDKVLLTVPPEQRPRVYLARGPDGLETGTRGSINTEIIERAGGHNVIDASAGRRGLTAVSIEQVIAANPDTLITWDPNFHSAIAKSPWWNGVDAVKRGRVYLGPTAPFGWIDRPPSVNRIFGLRWLASLFFPEQLGLDLRAATREFYALFYHVTPSEAELDTLLDWAQGRPPR